MPRPRHPKLNDSQWLRTEHKTKSLLKISHELKCSWGAVKLAFNRLGINPLGRTPPELRDRDWLLAKYAETSSTRVIAKYLGVRQSTVWNALKRMKIMIQPSTRAKKGCGIYLWTPDPNNPKRNKHLHRVLMEQYLRRPLKRNEHVHHVDGNPKNNAIENLIVLTAREHRREHAAHCEHICVKCGTVFCGGNRARYCKQCCHPNNRRKRQFG